MKVWAALLIERERTPQQVARLATRYAERLLGMDTWEAIAILTAPDGAECADRARFLAGLALEHLRPADAKSPAEDAAA